MRPNIYIPHSSRHEKIPATMWGHFLIRKPWHDVITAHQLGLAAARQIHDQTGEAWMRDT